MFSRLYTHAVVEGLPCVRCQAGQPGETAPEGRGPEPPGLTGAAGDTEDLSPWRTPGAAGALG